MGKPDQRIHRCPYAIITRSGASAKASKKRPAFQKRRPLRLETPVAETATIAKTDLPAGTTLGAIGETFYRGWAITREDALKHNVIPLGLAQGAVMTQPVKAGAYLTHGNCRVDDALKIVQLRRLQDMLLDNADATPPVPAHAAAQ